MLRQHANRPYTGSLYTSISSAMDKLVVAVHLRTRKSSGEILPASLSNVKISSLFGAGPRAFRSIPEREDQSRESETTIATLREQDER